jgi:hypothetical protein
MTVVVHYVSTRPQIFKANSAILNTLLTILNERLFDNGSQRYRVPLVCLVGASNEMPESEELDALYDRFLFRKVVRQVSATGLAALLSAMGSVDDDLGGTPRIGGGSNSSIGGGGYGGSSSRGNGGNSSGEFWGSSSSSSSSSSSNFSNSYSPSGGESPILRDSDFENIRAEAMRTVRVPEEVVNLLGDVRQFLQVRFHFDATTESALLPLKHLPFSRG